QPTAPQADLFTGQWTANGDFFRLDLVFRGLVNPPGTLGHGYPYEPFRYGPNPVFGYVEIDMDGNAETGGELDTPNLRYLGNAARFGGLPWGSRYAGHAARDGSAFDGSYITPPFVERNGEEFHIAFYGWEIREILRSDPNDMIFDAGESWTLIGRLFHRAHGYERFSYACCTGVSGSYEPNVQIQFRHVVDVDQTTVSLVYPLTNAGSASMRGEAEVQPPDGDASNQNSVLEAMDDLVFSAVNAPLSWRNNPAFPLIAPWQSAQPGDFLDPTTWKVTALVATAYTVAGQDAMFVWTDLAPDVVPGDFNGDGVVNADDLVAFDAFLAAADGCLTLDADGVVNGRVQLFDFARNFNVFDVNYDGVVDAADRPVLPALADLDGDADVDLADFGLFQSCFNGPNRPARQSGCSRADFDADGDVDLADFGLFQGCFNGPNRAPRCPG
ncbi:MAG: hypothetical protein ACPMAQ_15515, partial [Phycisphaerae bacterium]